MAKGIANILATGGRSEQTTGIECDLDMASLITGTAFRLTCVNAASGMSFVHLRGAANASMFSFGGDGDFNIARNVLVGGTLGIAGAATFTTTVTISAGGLTLTTGDITVSAGDVTALDGTFSGTITGASIGADSLLETTDLVNQQYAFDRTKRYCDWMEDFVVLSRYSGCTQPWFLRQESGTTATFEATTNAPHGVAAPIISTDAYAAAHIEYRNKFVKFTLNKKYWFEARVKTGKLYKHGYFVGLTAGSLWLMPQMTGTSSAVGSGNAVDYIGFTSPPRTNKWHFVFGTQGGAVIGSGSSTPNVATGATGTYVRLGFYLETTGVTAARPYVDGTIGAVPTELTNQAGTSYPWNTSLCPVAGVSHNLDTGTSLAIDYIKMVSTR